MNYPWTEATAAAIGADWLLDAIAPSGAFGRRARALERSFRTGDESAARTACERAHRIAGAVAAGELASLRATIGGAPDPGPALALARAGGVLGDVDFFELSRFLDAVAGVAEYAAGPAFAAVDVPQGDPALRALLAPGRTAERTFYLDDAFDPSLARARGESAGCQARYDAARSRLATRVAQYAGIERVRDGEFVLMRDRTSGPFPPEIRVVREAPTYVLCEIALDATALEALAARDEAVARVASAEEDVRARLSRSIAQAAPALERGCDALGRLDLTVARAEFAQRYACTIPEITDVPAIVLEDARYLPLASALERHHRGYAPISIALEGMGVVTGPNMGGKTAALRTLGFVAACVALGVPVPAASARVSLVDEIAWLGIGVVPEDDGLLSAFGSEVVELRAFLERAPRSSLVLVDEFARTTSPREGRALLIALLETLQSRGALGLAATHLSGVAAGARVAHFASGGFLQLPAGSGESLTLEAALLRIAAAMDYRLIRVDESAVPAADAIALAAALGLDAALIARAQEAL